MPEFSVKITNINQIRAAFLLAPQEMAAELNNAIHQSIFVIERESKKNTPVDTGRLRASTQTLFSPLRGEVGTNVFYDIFVHEGTRYMKARPYLLNAIKSTEQQIQTYFEKAVEKVVDNLARGT